MTVPAARAIERLALTEWVCIGSWEFRRDYIPATYSGQTAPALPAVAR